MSLMRQNRPAIWAGPAWSDPFDLVIRDFFRNIATTPTAQGTRDGDGMLPMRVEEFVADGAHVLRVELPDIDPDKDVQITITDHLLTVSARREQRAEQKDAEHFRSEFRYGRYERSFTLPDGVGEKDVTATYRDGILEVRVPVPAEPPAPEPTRVPITHS